MREYSTQMEAARKGIITPEMKIVAKKKDKELEDMDVDQLMKKLEELN